jgi:hypothetical protein
LDEIRILSETRRYWTEPVGALWPWKPIDGMKSPETTYQPSFSLKLRTGYIAWAACHRDGRLQLKLPDKERHRVAGQSDQDHHQSPAKARRFGALLGTLHLKHLRECSSTFRSRWEGLLIRNRGVVQGGLLAHVSLKHFAGVDDMVKRGIADPMRLGIGGWSYGGYMAEWAITQTDRLRFAISGVGMADLATEFGTEARPAGDEWYYGVPYENLAGFQKSSAITFIKNAKTPTFILQGEMDTTDPISRSQMLYRGLKRYHVPAEFVVYPREPHGLREPKHIAD